MKKQKRNFLHFNLQSGGMMVELMLSVALAAIAIPFIFRYQKNTIERAHNIAMVKQMEIVQKALEKCIVMNRGALLNHSGSHIYSDANTNVNSIDCLILANNNNTKGLVQYGLSTEFVNKYKNNNPYALRILKSQDDVLQGVVVFNDANNADFNAMRTHEIVNMGGGKIGFIDNANKVRGGFDSFNRNKTDYGLAGMNAGLVGVTSTMRGNAEYLWRVATANPADARMLSDLNLNGQTIDNVNLITAQNALFDDELMVHIASIDSMQFIKNTGFDNNTGFHTNSVQVNGDVYNTNTNSELKAQCDNENTQYCGTLTGNNKNGVLTLTQGFINQLTTNSLVVNNSLSFTLTNTGSVIRFPNCPGNDDDPEYCDDNDFKDSGYLKYPQFIVGNDATLDQVNADLLVAKGAVVPKLEISGNIVQELKFADGTKTYFFDMAGSRSNNPRSAELNMLNLIDLDADFSLSKMFKFVYDKEEEKWAAKGKTADETFGLKSKTLFEYYGIMEKLNEGEHVDVGQFLKVIELVKQSVTEKYNGLVQCLSAAYPKQGG